MEDNYDFPTYVLFTITSDLQDKEDIGREKGDGRMETGRFWNLSVFPVFHSPASRFRPPFIPARTASYTRTVLSFYLL